MDYTKIGALALVVIAVLAVYFVFFREPEDEAVLDDEVEKISQFLTGSKSDSRVLSESQLDDLQGRGLVLMRRLPSSADPEMQVVAMGYRGGRGRGGRGRGRGGRRRGGFRRRYGGRRRWRYGRGRFYPYHRYYLWNYPLHYYDIWNPNYYLYHNRYCWVRGHDGYMYAIQYVNGRCPLDLIV